MFFFLLSAKSEILFLVVPGGIMRRYPEVNRWIVKGVLWFQFFTFFYLPS